jgi:hypothetical protein
MMTAARELKKKCSYGSKQKQIINKDTGINKAFRKLLTYGLIELDLAKFRGSLVFIDLFIVFKLFSFGIPTFSAWASLKRLN